MARRYGEAGHALSEIADIYLLPVDVERDLDELEAENERLRAERDLHERNYAESIRTVAALARNAGGVLRLPESVMREVEGYVEVNCDYASGETVIRGR